LEEHSPQNSSVPPSDTTPIFQATSVYDNLIFGPSFPNVRDYYKEVSNNIFTWRKAAVLKLSFRNVGDLPQNLAEARKQAFISGFDFKIYDLNSDKKN
jgi:hypothetical protein